jgi:hypothetical protein
MAVLRDIWNGANQFKATTSYGVKPSDLQSIINAGLANTRKSNTTNRQFQMQIDADKAKDAYNNRMLEMQERGLNQQMEANKSAQVGQVMQGLTNTATTGLGLLGEKGREKVGNWIMDQGKNAVGKVSDFIGLGGQESPTLTGLQSVPNTSFLSNTPTDDFTFYTNRMGDMSSNGPMPVGQTFVQPNVASSGAINYEFGNDPIGDIISSDMTSSAPEALAETATAATDGAADIGSAANGAMDSTAPLVDWGGTATSTAGNVLGAIGALQSGANIIEGKGKPLDYLKAGSQVGSMAGKALGMTGSELAGNVVGRAVLEGGGSWAAASGASTVAQGIASGVSYAMPYMAAYAVGSSIFDQVENNNPWLREGYYPMVIPADDPLGVERHIGGTLAKQGIGDEHTNKHIADALNPLGGLSDIGTSTENTLNTVANIATGGVWSAVTGLFDCIIITACTHRYSPEVNVAREYRDKYMTQEQLRGYYWFAEKLVPQMYFHPKLKRFVKKHLVDHIVRHCEEVLDKPNKHGSWIDKFVTKTFLMKCSIAGHLLGSYVRRNGEVY